MFLFDRHSATDSAGEFTACAPRPRAQTPYLDLRGPLRGGGRNERERDEGRKGRKGRKGKGSEGNGW